MAQLCHVIDRLSAEVYNANNQCIVITLMRVAETSEHLFI